MKRSFLLAALEHEQASRWRSLELTLVLAQIAGLVVNGSACAMSHGSCDDVVPLKRDVDVSADAACKVATAEALGGGRTTSELVSVVECNTACGGGFTACALPDDYAEAYRANALTGAGGCPPFPSTIKLTCTTVCEGRQTAGVGRPLVRRDMSIGDYLSTCSYLESESVHAFARLRTELAAHGAPRDLLDASEEAERDEVRHTEMTRALARRFGGAPLIASVGAVDVRPFFEVARENAVEGCVRETYGAVVALVRAARSKDPHLREAMLSIARDECKHAELSWRIIAWTLPRLGAAEREDLLSSMDRVVRELAIAGDEASGESRSFLGIPSARERRTLVRWLVVAFRALLPQIDQ